MDLTARSTRRARVKQASRRRRRHESVPAPAPNTRRCAARWRRVLSFSRAADRRRDRLLGFSIGDSATCRRAAARRRSASPIARRSSGSRAAYGSLGRTRSRRAFSPRAAPADHRSVEDAPGWNIVEERLARGKGDCRHGAPRGDWAARTPARRAGRRGGAAHGESTSIASDAKRERSGPSSTTRKR